jgi:hypothetical protein
MQSFPSPPPVDGRGRRNARLILLLTSVTFGLLLIPGFGVIMISPMVLENPGAEANPTLVAFTYALLSYPALAILSILGSWAAYALKRYPAAIAVSLLPVLPLLAALVCFLLLER